MDETVDITGMAKDPNVDEFYMTGSGPTGNYSLGNFPAPFQFTPFPNSYRHAFLARVGSAQRNVLFGRVFLDMNSNMILDSNEVQLAGQSVRMAGSNRFTTTNIDGNFKYNVDSGFVDSLVFPFPPRMYHSEPKGFQVSLSSWGNVDSNYVFALQPRHPCHRPSGFDERIADPARATNHQRDYLLQQRHPARPCGDRIGTRPGLRL